MVSHVLTHMKEDKINVPHTSTQVILTSSSSPPALSATSLIRLRTTYGPASRCSGELCSGGLAFSGSDMTGH